MTRLRWVALALTLATGCVADPPGPEREFECDVLCRVGDGAQALYGAPFEGVDRADAEGRAAREVAAGVGDQAECRAICWEP